MDGFWECRNGCKDRDRHQRVCLTSRPSDEDWSTIEKGSKEIIQRLLSRGEMGEDVSYLVKILPLALDAIHTLKGGAPPAAPMLEEVEEIWKAVNMACSLLESTQARESCPRLRRLCANAALRLAKFRGENHDHDDPDCQLCHHVMADS